MKILYWLPLFTVLTVSFCISQDTIIQINNIPSTGVLLNKGWKFQPGDNPEYAKAAYDDGTWQPIDPTRSIHDSLPQIPKSAICWFRLHISVDSTITRPLALVIEQSGASEIYLNGRLIARFGVLSANPREIRAYDPEGKPLLLPENLRGDCILAVRFAQQPSISYAIISPGENTTLKIRVNTLEASMEQYYEGFSSGLSILEYFRAGVFFILTILHLAFYLFYPSQKANLHFFLFALIMGISQVIGVRMLVHVVAYKFYYYNLAQDLNVLSYLFLNSALYNLLGKRRGLAFWTLTTIIIGGIVLNAFTYSLGLMVSAGIAPNLIGLEIARIAFLSVKARKRGGWLILCGAIGFLLFTLAYLFSFIFGFQSVFVVANFQFINIAFNFATLSIPVATSIYLGLDFAFTNRTLKQKLSEVENLSQKTILQEQEKQNILATQNETLEKQVRERTTALSKSLKDLSETQAQLIQSEKMASLGELTAGIAHEIQNPLNFVNNFSEVNLELDRELKGKLDKLQIPAADKVEIDEIIGNIENNEVKIIHHGKRADAIVKGMLQHSSSATGVKVLTDINALADEYLRIAYHGARAKDSSFNPRIQTDFDNFIGKINIIPQGIGRVLLNLYNNAFYAVSEKRKSASAAYQPIVSVSSRIIDDKVEISVKDNGNGIPQKVVDKIFQPFFTTKPTGQGTGLGLSLSYDIIKAHGGEIRVHTKEGEGSEFIMQLPLSKES